MHIQRYRNEIFGIAITGILAMLAWYLAKTPWLVDLRISPLIVGIILGLLFGNTLRSKTPHHWSTGYVFCTKRILRLGVMLYGFRLTFQQIYDIGLPGLFLSVLMVVSTFLIGSYIGTRWLKMDRDTSMLCSIGAAICGAAAVLAAEGLLRAKPHQAAVAVATVVLFGSLAMFIYPFLFNGGWLSMTEVQYGLYTGASVHEVAHVVAAGAAVPSPVAEETAVIVKMTRVLLLAPMLLIIGWWLRWQASHTAQTNHPLSIPIPWFVFGFIAFAGFNSLQIIPTESVEIINLLDTFLLTMAMTALGIETNIQKLKAIGAKPFYLAFMLFLWLLLAGYGLTILVTA